MKKVNMLILKLDLEAYGCQCRLSVVLVAEFYLVFVLW